jgi:hypothetical protein
MLLPISFINQRSISIELQATKKIERHMPTAQSNRQEEDSPTQALLGLRWVRSMFRQLFVEATTIIRKPSVEAMRAKKWESSCRRTIASARFFSDVAQTIRLHKTRQISG